MRRAGQVFKFGEDFKKDLKQKQGDWKSKLSGAFNSEQIFFSLFVLGVFYAGYTLANADGRFDADAKHEDDITESCHCKSSHQKFYRGWFGICCGLWLILHTYTYVAVRFRSIENFLKFIDAILHRAPKYLLKKIRDLFKSCYKYCRKHKTNNVTASTPSSGVDPSVDPGSQPGPVNKNDAIFKHYIKVLWFQYYKLYVVGYGKGEDEQIILDHGQTKDGGDKVKETTGKSDDKQKLHCFCWSADVTVAKKSDEEQAVYTCSCNEEFGLCFNILKNLNHIVLLLIKFSAQLLTMPLLFLQIFDTYSLLCFSPKLYCENSSEYKLRLAQAAITMLFYGCLAISQLASTMLTWTTWPNKHNKGDEIKTSETQNR